MVSEGIDTLLPRIRQVVERVEKGTTATPGSKRHVERNTPYIDLDRIQQGGNPRA